SKNLKVVYIIADALDECSKNRGREELLALIKEVKEWSLPNIHLLVTSRQESDIGEVLSPLLDIPAIPIKGSQVNADIELHIRDQLATDPKLMKWSKEVKAEI